MQPQRVVLQCSEGFKAAGTDVADVLAASVHAGEMSVDSMLAAKANDNDSLTAMSV